MYSKQGLPFDRQVRVAFWFGHGPNRRQHSRRYFFSLPQEIIIHSGLDLNEKLLPEILRENGYSTHHVGKWHLGHCNSSYLPHNRGFDTFYGHTGGVLNYFQHNRAVGSCKYLDYFENDRPIDEKTGVYSTFDFGDHARKIYNKIDDPKFIYLALNAPHGPLMAPENMIEEMRQLYPDSPRTRLTYLAMVKAIDMEMEKLLGTIWMKNEKRDTIIATGLR